MINGTRHPMIVASVLGVAALPLHFRRQRSRPRYRNAMPPSRLARGKLIAQFRGFGPHKMR